MEVIVKSSPKIEIEFATKVVKVGDGSKINVDSALSTESENPVMNKVITVALNEKVDKVSGKGLSTNDYTTSEKDKLASLENYNDSEIKSQLTELSAETSYDILKLNNGLDDITNAQEPSVNLFRPSLRGKIYQLTGNESIYENGYTQIIKVSEGDRLYFLIWNGTEYIAQKFNAVSAFYKGFADYTKGKEQTTEYLVPSGVDEVRVGIVTNIDLSKLCIIKNGVIPTEQVLYNAKSVKVDTSLSLNMPADAKAVGEALALKANRSELASYVLKESNKGLSTNDFTNADKQKLQNLENYNDKTLRDYIDKLESDLTDSLALKADKTELDSSIAEVNASLSQITKEREPSANLFEPTITGMFYSQYGKELAADDGRSCQIVQVQEGDILRMYVWNGTSYVAQKVNAFAAYSNGTCIGASGASGVTEYLVPSGVDEVRVGVVYADITKLCLLKNNTDVPSEQIFFGGGLLLRTDTTFTKSGFAADAKAVGDVIRPIAAQTDLIPTKLSRKDWTSENADKDNIYNVEDKSNIAHAAYERYASLREVKRMTDDDVLVQGYCGYYEDASGNITPNTIQWKIYKGGILYIGGYGKFYDFVKGVECCKNIEEINAEVTRLGSSFWYYGFNANNVNGISTPFGESDQHYGDGNAIQYQPKRYVPFGEEINADNGKPKGYAAPWYQYRNEVSMTDGITPEDDRYTSHDLYNGKNPNGIYYDRVCIEEDLTKGGITYLGDWTFYRCCVDSLILPTKLQKIGAWGVRYSPTMRTLVMYDSITEIEDHGVSRHLSLVTLRISAALQKIGYQAMGQNPCIKRYAFPITMTIAEKNALAENHGLENIVAEGLTEIPYGFATNAANLSRASFGELTTIGTNAFFKSRFNEFTIGATMTTIDGAAFANAKIEYLTIENTDILTAITANSYGNVLNAAKRIYVPQDASVSATFKALFSKAGSENGYDIWQRKPGK